MRRRAFTCLALTLAGCVANSDSPPSSTAGYLGVEKIAIVAKGME